jgi:hypothetical protein
MPAPLPNEFNDYLFVFLQYGNTICHPTPAFAINRTDLCLFQADRDTDEFDKGFHHRANQRCYSTSMGLLLQGHGKQGQYY